MKKFKLNGIQGDFAVCDYGGKGKDILLVHGTGHNLAVWQPLVDNLKSSFHLYAYDMRGHGQTTLDSIDFQQYWQDIEFVAKGLRIKNPLLVGHSTGGYAVTAYAADGGVCSGIVILDGFTLDTRDDLKTKAWELPQDKLFSMFRYGWHANGDELEAYIKNVCDASPDDWLNAGIDKKLIAEFTRRAFLNEGGIYLRRPTMEELAVVGKPDPRASIYPAVDIYARISVPMGCILASRGLYADRRDDILALVHQAGNRYFTEIDSNHNVHMQKPAEVAAFICRHFGD